MTRIASATVCVWTVVASFVPVTCFAEAPSVEDVLKICRENREKLNPLHVRATHIEERTDAYAKARQQDALGIETILKTLDKGESIPELEKQMPGISSPKYKEILRQQVKNSQALAASVRFEHKYEFIIDHDNYQVRSAAAPSEEDWRFPDAPLSADSLKKDYADTRIYSRVVGRSPPAKIWPGKPSPDSESSVMITTKHIGETHNLRFPPFMQALHPQIYYVHPIDIFFSGQQGLYGVFGAAGRSRQFRNRQAIHIFPQQNPSPIFGKAKHGRPDNVSSLQLLHKFRRCYQGITINDVQIVIGSFLWAV